MTRRDMRCAPAATRIIGLLFCALGLVACSGSTDTNNGGSTDGVSVGQGGPDELFAETASFEVVAAKPQRVMVGLSTTDGRVLHGGTVELDFYPPDATAKTAPVTATAAYLPVPGSPMVGTVAKIGRPSEGIGVYAASAVKLATPGIWTIDVRAPGPSGKRFAQAAIDVVAKAKVPDVGQPAPPTDNPTATSPVGRELLDSRSGPNGMGNDLPDPTLHTASVDSLLKAGTPFVLVASTPAYCQSKFCGPITDLIDTIANEPAFTQSGVAFVHLEVYAKFGGAGNTELNPWVVPWIDGYGDGHEPWVFVVDAKGRIGVRFDNLVDEKSLRAAIQQVARK